MFKGTRGSGVRAAVAALVAAAVVGAVGAPAYAKPKAVTKATVRLAGDAAAKARGTLVAEHHIAIKTKPAYEILALATERLVAGSTYELWADDPTTGANDGSDVLTHLPPYGLKAPKNGKLSVRFDSRSGGLPFEATLAQLGAQRFQVRTAAGAVVLSGRFPRIEGLDD